MSIWPRCFISPPRSWQTNVPKSSISKIVPKDQSPEQAQMPHSVLVMLAVYPYGGIPLESSYPVIVPIKTATSTSLVIKFYLGIVPIVGLVVSSGTRIG